MSIQTKKFRTRQEIARTATNPKGKKYIIGLDAGYSAMKGFHENGHFCYPSYARRLSGELIYPSEEDILYRDLDTGELFILGYSAQNMAGSAETNDTDGELFSRKRYRNRKFRILCQAAIALAIQDKKDNRELVIQTGLPSSYEEADAPAMKKTLSQAARFELKIGTGKWRRFEFQVPEDHIYVMPQPAGSLYSVLIKPDGTYVPDAKKYLTNNLLVLDIGFGTFDFYGIKNRAVECKESIDEIGMKQVLKETSSLILEQMNEDIRVNALQKNLTSGYVTCLDEETMKEEERPLAPILETANDKVFHEAMDRAKSVTSFFRDYHYLIVTGGTGEAWYEMIREYLSGMRSLTILPGNINDHDPLVYSNVRGYYMYRYTLCK